MSEIIKGVRQMKGAQSIEFAAPPYILESACVCGNKEGEGPLKDTFDYIEEDSLFGCDTWEEAESALQEKTIDVLLEKSGYKKTDFRYIFAGDLMGQLIATTFGILKFEIPLFGLYGACSTMGEAISLASMTVAGGYANNVIAMASSHYASAEKTFRFPLEYSTQRPYSATWTVTGCGAVVIGNATNKSEKNMIKGKITGITTGKIVDYGCKDSQNMGACMAPAAADVIEQNLIDFGYEPGEYDKIITGDLGYVGQTILIDLLQRKGIEITNNHMDCGIEIFDSEKQDTHAGGSGCGCSATVLCGHILNNIKKGIWKKVLFVPTGALLSPTSFNEGQNVPGIAHAVMIEHPNK
ncbi:MAG: stage V sporulation protein AD [Lachnospiraceae bacterium]|nr:stage V sporulation protein AD [Lachnospiraceae bacterium]